MEPNAQNYVICPICAHSIHANAYVLTPDHEISIQTEKTGYKPVFLSVDGRKAFSLHNGDCVRVLRSKYMTKLARLSTKSFCDIFEKKMTGGAADER